MRSTTEVLGVGELDCGSETTTQYRFCRGDRLGQRQLGSSTQIESTSWCLNAHLLRDYPCGTATK
jgi:hypothetical protein